ncbi:peptide chain release factor N(5)-glutamine methyltransferase [Eggerthia catenaformis]|uniref:peptide chain release factor N(5)-glutamine methyltransferase n=1 Tax=Eggerthia catenaformis TaxID=31973 RepID=UPI003C700C4D
MTIRELIHSSELLMDEKQKDSNVPKVLFYHVSNMEPHELYLKMDEEVDRDTLEIYNNYLGRYLKGEPVQYIKGKEYFFAYEFKVNEDVLIPRYETEELVENILYHVDDYFKDYKTVKLCDVGTGSGAIAITLALEEEKLDVYATDISEKALAVAKENAKDLNAHITFYQGDMLQPLIDHHLKFDFFVSNPPYIPVHQDIDPIVKNNEPHVALFGGEDGLYFYRKMFERVKEVLNDKAILAFEMGFDQKELMEEALDYYFKDSRYQFIKDINGKNRMLFIYYNIEHVHTDR